MYLLLTLVVDTGVVPLLQHQLRSWVRRRHRRQRGDSGRYQRLPGSNATAGVDGDAGDDAEQGGVRPGEDEDVAAERRLVQSGQLSS